jgi:DNA-binding MarR family transcriptional regulator
MDRSSSWTGSYPRPYSHPHSHQHPHSDPPPPRQTWQNIHSPQSHINYWLKLADTRFGATLGRELKRWGLIASEWAALRELYRPTPLSPRELARALGMSKGGISKLIDRLRVKGLVAKRRSTFDRRRRAVSLSLYGRAIVPSLAFCEATLHRQFFRSLRTKGRQRLLAGLQRTLGAQDKNYMDQWISFRGDGGQWVFQAAWHSSVRCGPSGRPAFRRSEQSLQLFGRQLAESPAG